MIDLADEIASFLAMTKLWLHFAGWIKIHPYNIFRSSGTLSFIIEIEMKKLSHSLKTATENCD